MLTLASPAAWADSPSNSKGEEAKHKDQAAGTAASQEKAPPSDPEINSAVSMKMFFDRFFSPEQMKVNTSGGVVTLTGMVNDLRSKDRAVKIAEGIRGVRSVVDRLTVQTVSRPDTEIKQDIVNALLTDPTTDSYKVQVNVNGAVAELSGKVHSWTEKNLTAWVAKGIPGVKDIKNSIEVEYKTIRPDIDVSQDIMARIKRDPWLYQNQIKVEVDQGKVKLSGEVGSPAAKRRAHEAAWVAGVMTVNFDDLKVDPALKSDMMRKKDPSLAKSSQEIKEAIESSFLWDPRVNYFSPKVSVNNGVATLTGSVDSLIAKTAAEENAQNTVGVTSVVNKLKVDVKKRSDAEIAKDVKNSLRWNLPQAVQGEINVKVNGGVVSLTGDVNTPYQKWQARDAAMRVNGVVAVNNQVKLDTTQAAAFSDDKLKDRIESGIFWDPVVDYLDDQVNVSVKNGVATLSGTVDTWDEHWSATREAFDAGALTVKNSLTVEDAGISGKTYTYNVFPVITTTTYWVPMG